MQTDDQLLSAAVAGDEDALSLLLERYGPAVRDSLDICSKWQSSIDADDVMQVTYLEVFLRIGAFKPAGPRAFRAWVERIAQNNLLDFIRNLECDKRPQPKHRVNPPNPDEGFEDIVNNLPGSGTTVNSALAKKEANDRVKSALKDLPPDYERVLRLHFLEQLEYAEVAARMKRSPGAVRMLVVRALDRLNDLVGSSSRYFSDTA